MTSTIQTSVLRAAVLSAFDRGRYTVHFGTAPAGDDIAVVPSSINLDLAERDDDLLGSERFELFTDAEERELRREVREAFGADDHGPAVPVQDGPWRQPGGGKVRVSAGPSDRDAVVVYEFAMQDAVLRFGRTIQPTSLDMVRLHHVPDWDAASNADWVHVYDRVTRERRTLKRPGVDKIVKGMSELVWGLRAKQARMPQPGPLASAKGLVRGDVVMCRSKPSSPFIGRVAHITQDRLGVEVVANNRTSVCNVSDCSFVGRPDADGWMDWPGGLNPVGDASVHVLLRENSLQQDSTPEGCAGRFLDWMQDGSPTDIVRFRLVDMPPMPGDQST